MIEIIDVDASDVGNRSYLVTDGRKAIAIDPPRPVDRLLEELDRRALDLEIVAETHLHNDHLSGGLELSQVTGARYLVSAAEGLPFAEGICDGDRFRVGSLCVEVVATPGHTPHHLSFVVSDSGSPVAFTGGSLLVGTAGRTDLLGRERAAELAGEQWRSLRHLLEALPPATVVHPTHGFGSFCSASPAGSTTETTIAAERRGNPAALLDLDSFVEAMVSGLGEYPAYYAHMAEANRAGPAPAYLGPLPWPARLDSDVWVVDVRPRRDYAAGHRPRTVSAGVDGPLATYLGWTMPWGQPFGVVAADPSQLLAARRTLAHIGLQPVAAAVEPAATRTATMRLATFDDLAIEWTDAIGVIDVRRREEWDAGHLDGAVHIPVHRLPHALAEIPRNRQLWLHCAAGYRAALGASVLRRAGFDAVAVDDNWAAAARAGLTVSAG